jgi:hypothetical protein
MWLGEMTILCIPNPELEIYHLKNFKPVNKGCVVEGV